MRPTALRGRRRDRNGLDEGGGQVDVFQWRIFVWSGLGAGFVDFGAVQRRVYWKSPVSLVPRLFSFIGLGGRGLGGYERILKRTDSGAWLGMLPAIVGHWRHMQSHMI